MNLDSLVVLVKDTPTELLLKGEDSVGNPFQRSQIFTIYRQLFNEGCMTCTKYLKSYIEKIKNYDMDNPTPKSKYKFPGNPILSIGEGKLLCNASLKDGRCTDQDVENWVSDHPKRIFHFDKASQKALQEVLDNVKSPQKESVSDEDGESPQVVSDLEAARTLATDLGIEYTEKTRLSTLQKKIDKAQA